ncbi:MAG: lysoplasmalogenase [Lachnospiraceae bacterium]|nr:lysoplasmalogenase [Lachnospiraceae bacterium]
MWVWCLFLAIAGILVDLWFIKKEYAQEMFQATIFKGIASLFFVVIGFIAYSKVNDAVKNLVIIGLILGLIGDVFLNMRNLYEGALSNKIFAVGILAFMSGHFLYIAAMLKVALSYGGVLVALMITILSTVFLSLISIPPLMRRIIAPSKGLKIFGYVYLVVVITMYCASAAQLAGLLKQGSRGGMLCYGIFMFIGALFFLVSDFIMIYYSFGKKIKPLRAINLLTYYLGQLLIAASGLFFVSSVFQSIS